MMNCRSLSRRARMESHCGAHGGIGGPRRREGGTTPALGPASAWSMRAAPTRRPLEATLSCRLSTRVAARRRNGHQFVEDEVYAALTGNSLVAVTSSPPAPGRGNRTCFAALKSPIGPYGIARHFQMCDIVYDPQHIGAFASVLFSF